MMEKLLIFALGLVVSVQGQHGHCVAPPYLEADFTEIDYAKGFYRRGHLFYDAVEHRVRTIEIFSENATRPQVDELILFRERKRYVVDLVTRHCYITEVNEEFHPIKVPDEAHFERELSVGLPIDVVGAGVALLEWRLEERDPEKMYSGNFTYTFTREECVPVNDYYVTEVRSSEKPEINHYSRSYYDVVTGLTDPNVFHIPPECQHQKNDHQVSTA